jgi:hypothetical protein
LSKLLVQGAGQRSWLLSAVGLAQFLPGFVVGILVGLVIDLNKEKPQRLAGKDQTKEKKRPAEIRGGMRRGTKTAVASRPSSAAPASIEGGGELKMVNYFFFAEELALKFWFQGQHQFLG